MDPVDKPLGEVLRGTRFEGMVGVLAARGVRSAVELLVRGGELGLGAAEAAALRAAAGALFAPGMETPLSLSLSQTSSSLSRLSWGCALLDPLWGGGVLLRGLLELAGPAGSGKTQLALWLAGRALLAAPGSAVLFLCTEGEFPAKRFCQMRHLGLDALACLARIVVEKAASFAQLDAVLAHRLPILIAKTRAKLLVIDSIGALRSDYDQSETGPNTDHLWLLAQRLKWINDAYGVGVIILNQVSADMEAGGDAVKASLGLVWSNCVNTRVMVRKHPRRHANDENVLRSMTIEMCPYLPNFQVYFQVTTEGIKGVE
jgi:RecA/RadA recombinase